jgi:hypothetical protein
MFGRQPRLALDVVLGLSNSETSSHTYSTYVSELKGKLVASYELASTKTKLAQQRQKEGYDLRCRGAVVEYGDRVLVKIVAFDGKHKISDRWENEPYIVIDQPNPKVPVYVVQREDGIGSKRTLHRNLILPIGFLPVETSNDSIQSNNNHKQTSKPVSTPCVEPELEEQSQSEEEDENVEFRLSTDVDHILHDESTSSEVSLLEEVQDGQYSDE